MVPVAVKVADRAVPRTLGTSASAPSPTVHVVTAWPAPSVSEDRVHDARRRAVGERMLVQR
jgi:hypothetical protein